ncbi:VWA domain-containing protein [Reticulibacter mediterranei]|uniref:VWA domain-containing protein n=2 Tax=Reticulibacter mediterranei TaxID=2778369 RepID=A0A8J3IVC3_9CHLR|nr:VWA domain-containing protein [Reticulibacter mediterranei]
MNDVVADFNTRHYAACDGAITVKAIPIGSGQSMQQIVNGTIQPDIWSPAGSVWLTLLNTQWQQKHGSNLVGTGATDALPLVSSPIVIAMWKPEAEALGWPQKAIGWSDIASLSTDPRGWAAYGHAEFGAFKFGHTHPEYSNSGLDAVIAMNYAAVNKVRGLTTAEVNTTTTKQFINNVESSVIHYGDSTGFFADKMFGGGPSYLSAAVLYENLVVEANDGKLYPHLPYPVVAIYPKEGTFYSDHPFAILQASWVTSAKQTAAQVFRNFLLDQPQQVKALHYGFRPANQQIKLAAPLDSIHGIDITQPKTLLPIPGADVVQAIKTSWSQQRRKVNVMLILDRSGSMAATVDNVSKIEAAKQGLQEFINLLGDNDQLGLTVFSDQADILSPVSQLGPKRKDLLNRANNIFAMGGTRLFDTMSEQFQALQQTPSKNIRAIVILTDGVDTDSHTKLDGLLQQITAKGEDAGTAVKMFTIAYGRDANENDLKKIATSTGAQEFEGNPQNIKEVYNQISLFF